MRTFWPVPFGFIEPWNLGQFDRVPQLDIVQNILHPVIERFCPEYPVIMTAVHDESGHVA